MLPFGESISLGWMPTDPCPPERAKALAQQVSQVRSVIVASLRYLKRHVVPRTPADLAGANCIRFTGNGRSAWLLLERGREQRITVHGNLKCNHGMPAIDACVAGLGLGQFLRFQITDHLAADDQRKSCPHIHADPAHQRGLLSCRLAAQPGQRFRAMDQAGTGQDTRGTSW